jgi:cytochrome oxidase Cu insertion factor (SCO1/SenC/PrrC family)
MIDIALRDMLPWLQGNESITVHLIRGKSLMADVRVLCVSKQPRTDTHTGITHLGGQGWKWTTNQVVQSIENKTNSFYTYVNQTRANIGVVNGPNGKYVRTYADGKWTDNLLSLPECP